jgi:tetratricopeptide (TPR) repeat protein
VAQSPPTTSTTPPPTRRIGSYDILGRLGSGANGVVYRARHAETRTDAALKTIDAAGVSELDALRRETHALSRVRHPGVVRILSQGAQDSVAWYAMEFIEGTTLEDVWAKAEPPGSAWIESVPAMHQLCLTLAYLHGEGIVHRDLKPANVIVRANGQPVLVDFGFASHFHGPIGREMLEAGGEILGTFAYMAPEQARGEAVDARADLYALGCMLYELTTGQPPFIGTGWDVFEQQLSAKPLPPSERNPAIPHRLENLIDALLEKDPRRRLGYASDVAATLAELAPVPSEDRWPASRIYVYRPAFAGRRDTVTQIDTFLEGATRGSGQCVLVSGESGIGKTRLAMEVTQHASRRGLTIVTADCSPSEGTPGTAHARTLRLQPLRPLLGCVYAYCREAGLETTERVLGARGKTLVSYAPEFAKLPGQDLHPDAAPLPAQASRARLLTDLAATIEAFAHERPLLLVIDDLQWADELTLALLGSLGAGFYERTPIVILATFRSDEVNSALRDVTRLAHVISLQLARMAQPDVGAMVGDMLALPNAPAALVAYLARTSEGNPFFVAEYVRAAVNAGLLTRDVGGHWKLAVAEIADSRAYKAIALPHNVRALVGRRLADLGPNAQLCLAGAAVVGREFDLSLCAKVVGLDERNRLEAINQLLARSVVEGVQSGGYRFAHDKLREVAYEQIATDQRRFLHERVAEMLEAQHRGETDFADLYGSLAHHWGSAGIEDKAVDYLEKAGGHALRVGAHREAREWLEQLVGGAERLERGSGPLRRARWLRMLGEACLGAGELDACVEHTSGAMGLLGFPVPRSNVGWYTLLARQVAQQTAHRLSETRVEPKTPGAREKTFEAAIASGQLATTFYFKSHMPGALSHSLRCVNFAERCQQPHVAALSYAQLGYVAGSIGLRRVAQGYFERARTLRGDKDLTTFAAGVYFHAMYEMGLGHWEQSERLGREALELLERIQNRQEAEVARTIVANTLYFRGRFREAQERAQTMLESAEARSNAQHTGWGAFLTGRSLLALGDLPEACELLDRGHATLDRLADFVSLIMCEGLLARALLLTGRPQRALEVANVLKGRLRARGTVPLAQCLDGYASLVEVYLGLWEREAVWNVRELRGSARWACKALRRFARLYPMAVPSALRSSARESFLSGHTSRAIRTWRNAVRAAEDIQMPYEEARAHEELARALAPHEEASFHRREALRLFHELGCAQHVRELSET